MDRNSDEQKIAHSHWSLRSWPPLSSIIVDC